MFATGPRRRKSLKFVCVFGHDDITALMKVLHDMLLPRYGAARYRGRRGSCAFYLFIRAMEITDILNQNVPLEDVQYLAGHSNPSGHTDL